MTTWSVPSLCFLALGSFALAQAPDSGERPITLDVTVTDKSGKPVSGLHEQDFTVLENKHPQKILSFQEVKGSGPDSASQVKVILLIDEVNTDFKNVSYERLQVARFLGRDNGVLSRPVALAFLTDLSIKFTNFSQDGNALIGELNANAPSLRTIGRDQGVYGAGDRVDVSLKAVAQIAAGAAKEPGRKLLVWVSPGWPILTGPRIELSGSDQRGLFGNVVALSNALRSADVTIYSVDPIGSDDATAPRTTLYEEYLKGVKKPQQVQYGNLALQVLAVQSGGRVFNGENDLASEIAAAISSASDYYVLTYAGEPADGPNDYHSIEVKVDQPKVKVFTRTGYYAQP